MAAPEDREHLRIRKPQMQIDGSSIQLIERDSARRYDESDMMISLRESEDQTEIINIDDHRE